MTKNSQTIYKLNYHLTQLMFQVSIFLWQHRIAIDLSMFDLVSNLVYIDQRNVERSVEKQRRLVIE